MIDSAFQYRIGVDVGSHSLGLAAISFTQAGQPQEILNLQVIIHDSGIDPEENKAAKTRKETAGVARRVRRMIQRRAKRLKSLDRYLADHGFPIVEYPKDDPYVPWRVRAELASVKIEDAAERNWKLSVALRHMARHRGWRSPYERVESLFTSQPPSTEMSDLRIRTELAIGRTLPDTATPAQVVASYALSPAVKLRGPEGHLRGKLRQSDNAEEIRRIAEVQGLSEQWSKDMIRRVFEAESPRGSAKERVGKDPLPGQSALFRAPKAHSAFQRYRIASILCNVRIRTAGAGQSRMLTAIEKQTAFDFLWNSSPKTEPSWDDVASALKVSRSELSGVSTLTADGERAGTRPPVYVTNYRILACKSKKLQKWWAGAPQEERDAMIEAISYGGSSGDDASAGEVVVQQFLQELEDTELADLDAVASDLPPGRAAYSVDSLQRLTKRMLATDDDLHQARMYEFGVADDWTPPAEAIEAPVGSPAVDRVVKAFARWLKAVEKKWGPPESITIEHVRDGLMSEKAARELTRDIERRRTKNEANLKRMQENLGISSQGRRWDYVRFEAVTRQNSQCAYCGETITFQSAEMDHILPQAGPGSNSRRENLLAACHRCNLAKGNTPFATWAQTCGIEGVSVAEAVERVKHWTQDPKEGKYAKALQRAVISRLKRTDEDPEIDSRSMESIAWMANELRHRLTYHYKQLGGDTHVYVYRGGITAEARRASGMEWALPYYGASGKTRLDRRHHAVDAAVLTLLNPSIARTLAERVSIMRAQKYGRSEETWKTYSGSGPEAQRKFGTWKIDMDSLQHILCDAIADDTIPVLQPLRLRFANGALHDDTIAALNLKPLTDAFTLDEIDQASTPALWCALTRQPDFDPKKGLPENPDRRIRVKEQHLGPTDDVALFPHKAASILVRGGAVQVGSTIHHARVYELPGKQPTYGMVRVFRCDLAAHQSEDLFSVELPPQSVSMRDAERKVRDAVATGTAKYLGWLAVGDELQLDMSAFQKDTIGKFCLEFPGISHWRLDGINTNSQLRLRPVLLSSEGLLKEGSSAEARVIIDRPGWRPALNTVCKANLIVIRRNSLGRERWTSSAHLPVSWQIP